MEDNYSKEQYLQQLEEAYAKATEQNQALMQGKTSMFSSLTEDNLIRWQLDLKEDLNRIYHLLKGHVAVEDPKEGLIFVESDNEDLVIFNDYGVQILMQIMAVYLNRNTLLSNYDEETIKWKVLDIGRKIKNLIFKKYEKMFLHKDFNTRKEERYGEEDITWEQELQLLKEVDEEISQKCKIYPIIHQELVDTIHSAYLRALNGGERDSLRTARHVAQTDNAPTQQGYSAYGSPRKRSLNPMTWGR